MRLPEVGIVGRGLGPALPLQDGVCGQPLRLPGMGEYRRQRTGRPCPDRTPRDNPGKGILAPRPHAHIKQRV